MTDSSAVVVRRSKIQGRGVYAARDLAEGERIIEYTGKLITSAEADATCDDETMRRHHTFLFAVDDKYVIDATHEGSEARYINHSCDPNCESVVVRRRVYIHALRPIAAGEELVYDYWYVTDDDYSLADLQRIYPCRCKSPSCRGTLARPPPQRPPPPPVRVRRAPARTR
jgi:SET domain-containing protein